MVKSAKRLTWCPGALCAQKMRIGIGELIRFHQGSCRNLLACNVRLLMLRPLICCCLDNTGRHSRGRQGCADLGIVEDVVAGQGTLLRLAHLPDLAVGRRRELHLRKQTESLNILHHDMQLTQGVEISERG